MAYLGHAWTKGCDCGCEEREGYEYQQDDCNCDFYSLLTDEEFSQLENEVENTGKFKASYLYHLGNSDSDKVEHWLELEVVDDIGDIYKAARLLATDFGQTTLAKVVCKHLLTHQNIDEILEDTDNRIECHEPEEELAEFKEFLEHYQIELLSQKLDSELTVKPMRKGTVKI